MLRVPTDRPALDHDLTGVYGSSESKRESPSRRAGHADEEIQVGADCALLRQIEVEIANWKTPPSLPGCSDLGANVLSLAERVQRVAAGSSQATVRTGGGECQAEAAGGGAVFLEADSEGCRGGKILSPERSRGAVEHARRKSGVSERQACRVLRQWRGDRPLSAGPSHGRGCVDARHHHAGQRVWPLWLPANQGFAAARGQGPCATHLAARRAESASKTASTGARLLVLFKSRLFQQPARALPLAY